MEAGRSPSRRKKSTVAGSSPSDRLGNHARPRRDSETPSSVRATPVRCARYFPTLFRRRDGGQGRRLRFRIEGTTNLSLILVLILLVLVFGGGGFYLGPPFHLFGGGLGLLLVIVIIVLLVRG